MINSVMDLHTHTIVSGHAYNTFKEMAYAASEKGLEVLGITEHGPSMPGSCHNFYFHNLKILPRQMFGVRLLLGAEVNVVDYDGKIDLSQREIEPLDVVIASLHQPCVRHGSMEENTRAYLKVMENPYVDIIGHPDDGRYEVDYERLVEGAARCHKVLELNNNSLSPYSYRSNARENDLKMLSLCKEYRVPIVMSSDAHYETYVGELTLAKEIVAAADFPEELVLNRSYEALKPYLHSAQRLDEIFSASQG